MSFIICFGYLVLVRLDSEFHHSCNKLLHVQHAIFVLVELFHVVVDLVFEAFALADDIERVLVLLQDSIELLFANLLVAIDIKFLESRSDHIFIFLSH